jgi:hypothetical protein
MNRIHLRHDVGIEQFLAALVNAAAEAGADRERARAALRGALSAYLLQADICGIFSNCDDVNFFDPFVKIPE